MRKNNEKGYTMIETLMYISILIVLGGILASYAHNTFLRYKIGRVNQQIIDLKKAIISFTAADENYANLSAANMNSTKSLPMDMKGADTTKAYHALNGEIVMGPVSQLLNENKEDYKFMFYITFKNLPSSACTELITQGQFYGDGSDMDSLLINLEDPTCTEKCKYKHGWQFEYSFYPKTQILNNKILTGDNENNTKSPNIHPSIADAVAACDATLNTITWIFS